VSFTNACAVVWLPYLINQAISRQSLTVRSVHATSHRNYQTCGFATFVFTGGENFIKLIEN